MNVLIAGASGYVGKRLVSMMKSRGYCVYTIKRQNKLFSVINNNLMTEIASGDFVKIRDNLVKRNFICETVINLAGDTNKGIELEVIPSLCESNITFNASLASLSAQIKANRYISISTYSISMNGSNYDPQTLYAATKFAGEKVLQFLSVEHGLDTLILQFYDIYGPKHHETKLIPLLLEAALSGKAIEISQGEQEFSPLFVDDACEAIIHAINVPISRKFNEFSVRGPEIFKVKELPALISSELKIIWNDNQLIIGNGYRRNEIMKVAPLYPALPSWLPSFSFSAGLRMMIAN